jgi:ATP-dependent Lon protease
MKGTKTMDNNSVRRRGDFNPDIRAMFSAEQLKKLTKELGIETPEEKGMPAVKDKLRKQIVRDLTAKKAEQPQQDDIQGLLRMSAAADLSEDQEIV